MMGTDLEVPLAYTEDGWDPAESGVPFSWAESKSVDFFATFFKDMGIDDVFDVSVGSCAAAIGAFYANVGYDGVCLNPIHKAWCEQLMNKAMFAVVADGGAGASDEYTKKVLHFFGPAVDEGMRMLKADANGGDPPENTAPQPEDNDNDDGFDD